MSYKFGLAPMSPSIKGITIALLVLPLIFGIWALVTRDPMAFGIFLFMVALYVLVWVGFRPSSFTVTERFLEIVFPGWRRRISLRDISGVRILSQTQFSQEFGWAIRIGAGGLWGGFGGLWTEKQGLIEFYISRADEFVIIERSHGRTLMITPENTAEFVDTTRRMLANASGG